MNATAQKVVSFVKRKKPQEVNPVENEKAVLYEQIHSQAKKIVRLQGVAHIHIVVLDQYHDETQHTVAGMELEAAEQVFFTLFNRLRVLYGGKPLKGKKFTGEYNYEAHVK